MKKLLIIALIALPMSVFAQKYALVDMEYILKNVPAYERANEQLNQINQYSSPMHRNRKPKKQSWQRKKKPAT